MKKAKTNLETLRESALKLGLKVESVQTSVHTRSLLIANEDRFYIANSGEPGFYPETRQWNTKFAKSKLLLQKVLKRKGYKVITSKEVRFAQLTSIKALYAHLDKTPLTFPVLIKPDQGLRGQGISVASNRTQLKRSALVNYKKGNDFMLQPILTHAEYRILVINGEVMLMHSKKNPYVVGDGVSSIKELLFSVKNSKKDAAYISSQYLVHQAKPSTVLKKGDMFEYHLTKKPTADFYETNKIPPVCRTWALKLAQDVNFAVVGIDVFIPKKFTDTNTYIIIELNSNPGVNYLPEYCNDKVTAHRIFEKVLVDYFEIEKKTK